MLYNGNQWLDVPFSSDWNPGAGDFCISVWLYSSSTATQSIFRSSTTSEYKGIWIVVGGSSSLLAFIGDDISREFFNFGAGTLILNSLNHYVFQRKSSMMYLYRNGVSIFTPALSTKTVTDSVGNTDIGSSLGANRWDGRINDLRYYNRALSDDEIKSVFSRKGKDHIVKDQILRPNLLLGVDGVAAASTVYNLASSLHNFTSYNLPEFKSEPLGAT